VDSAAHLLLVGIPGAGKSTVGRELARRMNRPFVDLDEDIETRTGQRITEIFSSLGEMRFREMEREATERLARAESPMVVAPGGGWITIPGLVDVVRPPSQLVWLRLSPARAIQRLGAGISARPLLSGPDPLANLTALLSSREPFYLQADHVLSVDSMTPTEVVDSILALARH